MVVGRSQESVLQHAWVHLRAFAPVPLLPAHPAVQLRLGGRLMPERGPASMAERRLHRRRTARGGCAPTRAAVPGRALVRNGGATCVLNRLFTDRLILE